jgi:hypothetical protein
MSATFDKLKAILADKKTLTNEQITAAIGESGEMTPEELTWIESERLRLEREGSETITLEAYLEASKVLDTADPSSDEYKKAEVIVNKYESGQ